MVSPAADWTPLVKAVAERQDRDAFIVIFDYFTPRLEAYLARLGLEPAMAEDIAQDVMMTLWRKASLFDPAKSSLSTWLYRIARNRRIDLSRRERLDFIDPQSPGLLDLPAEGAADQIMDGQQRDDIVRGLIRDLPPEQRDLVALAFYQGLSHAQIAQKTGLPLGTVKSRLRLAFSRLRRALEGAGVMEPR